MPCTYDDGGESVRFQRRQFDDLTRLLCEACSIIEDRQCGHRMSAGLREWWAAHKEADRERESLEKVAAEREKRRVAGLLALDEDQATALGLLRQWCEVRKARKAA